MSKYGTHKYKGIPVYAGYPTFGDVFYLHSGTGNDVPSHGDIPKKPFATLDYAIDQMADSNNDTLIVMPYHAETITGVGGITVDKIGINILGQGRYDARPTFLMDGANTVTALFTAADTTMDNLKFHAGHADIAIWGKVTAKGVRISNCYWEENTTEENWVDIIHAGTADNDYDGLELVDNEINLSDDAHVTAIDLLKDCQDVKIIGNKITGDFNASPFAPIYMADNEIAKNIQVFHNLIHNLHDADAVVGISMLEAVSTGWMMYNHCYALDTAGETPFLTGATGIYCSQNYYSYQATLSGFEYPVIGTLG